MTTKQHWITLNENVDIKASIENYLVENKISKALIQAAVGSVKDLVFTVPQNDHIPLETKPFSYAGPAEVLSFSAEILAIEDMDPKLKSIYKNEEGFTHFIHIHASVALADSSVVGGGLKAGRTFRGMSIFLVEVE